MRSSFPQIVPRVFLLVAFVSCSHGTRSTPEGVIITPDGHRLVTEYGIKQSGARTAWDALQRTVPFFTFRENNHGGPSRVEHRGRSSIVLRDQPLILIDDVELTDFGLLGGMPASDILQIEVLEGIDATTRYGTNATKGVIKISTKSSVS